MRLSRPGPVHGVKTHVLSSQNARTLSKSEYAVSLVHYSRPLNRQETLGFCKSHDPQFRQRAAFGRATRAAAGAARRAGRARVAGRCPLSLVVLRPADAASRIPNGERSHRLRTGHSGLSARTMVQKKVQPTRERIQTIRVRARSPYSGRRRRTTAPRTPDTGQTVTS